MYELRWDHYLRAALAAGGAAVPLAFLGALLLPPRMAVGMFPVVISLLLGIAAGAVVSAAVEFATGRKRGTAVQLAAALGVVAAVALRLLFGDDFALVTRDLTGAVAAVAGVVYAWGRLR